MYHKAMYECDKCSVKFDSEDGFKRYRIAKEDFYHLCKKCEKEFNKVFLNFIGRKIK